MNLEQAGQFGEAERCIQPGNRLGSGGGIVGTSGTGCNRITGKNSERMVSMLFVRMSSCSSEALRMFEGMRQ